ncbi:MAG: response regulator [Chitinophagaceae bacterium]
MILIVDDKQENLFSLRKLLEVNKFEVDTALSGEEALRKILKKDYSLIILDVQMPGMDGYEVAEAISGNSKANEIPIIFLSAVHLEKKFITKGYQSGGLDYVTKPVDPDILLLKIKTFTHLYQKTVELRKLTETLCEEVLTRKRAEENLSNSMATLESIMVTIPQIAFSAYAEGNVEFVNEYWYKYSADEFSYPETHPKDTSFESWWRIAANTQAPVVAEIRIRKLDNHEFRYHLMMLTPVITEQRVVKWVGILTDIHEQKMANEVLEKKVEERTRELRIINKELESTNRDLQQFASVASHDLKEPLRKIQLFTSIVKDKFILPGSEAKEYIDRIINSSERMSNLITDLLNYSVVSGSESFENTDLKKLITECLAELEVQVREKHAVVNISGIPNIDLVPSQICQVFQNLLSNALKFSRPGIDPVIEVSACRCDRKDFASPKSEHGAYCRISVRDNGIGFNEIYLDRIFTIFQRLHSRTKYEGTGIGLAIVKKIIEKHDGIITAESQEGAGATFIIILPIEHQSQ